MGLKHVKAVDVQGSGFRVQGLELKHVKAVDV